MGRKKKDNSPLVESAVQQALPDMDQAMLDRPDALIVQLDKDPWYGLTDRQKQVQEMFMRGISQTTMGKILCISQSMVFKELTAIRKKHAERGVAIDKNTYAGETISIYEELFTKALKTFYEIDKENALAPQMKLQAINTMATLREKQTKLLMDLGIIDKASIKVDHSLTDKRTFVENWSSEAKQKLANKLLEAEFDQLEEPVPPEPEDADVIEEENDE